MRLIWSRSQLNTVTRVWGFDELGFGLGFLVSMKIGLSWDGLIPDMACTSCKHNLNELVQWRILALDVLK